MVYSFSKSTIRCCINRLQNLPKSHVSFNSRFQISPLIIVFGVLRHRYNLEKKVIQWTISDGIQVNLETKSIPDGVLFSQMERCFIFDQCARSFKKLSKNQDATNIWSLRCRFKSSCKHHCHPYLYS